MIIKYRNRLFLCAYILLCTSGAPVFAQPVNLLTIAGDDDLPGIVGSYSPTASFSWLNIVLGENNGGFSWALGHGTDEGILFGEPQSGLGEMFGIRPVFNQDTTFFSVGAGLSIDAFGTVDMANLRMFQAGTIIDIGSGSGFDTLVPLVADISTLALGANGWMMNPDETYNLVYNSSTNPGSTTLALHLYGSTTVPAPPAIVLFISGLGIAGFVGRRKKKTGTWFPEHPS